MLGADLPRTRQPGHRWHFQSVGRKNGFLGIKPDGRFTRAPHNLHSSRRGIRDISGRPFYRRNTESPEVSIDPGWGARILAWVLQQAARLCNSDMWLFFLSSLPARHPGSPGPSLEAGGYCVRSWGRHTAWLGLTLPLPASVPSSVKWGWYLHRRT